MPISEVYIGATHKPRRARLPRQIAIRTSEGERGAAVSVCEHVLGKERDGARERESGGKGERSGVADPRYRSDIRRIPRAVAIA